METTIIREGGWRGVDKEWEDVKQNMGDNGFKVALGQRGIR